MNKWYPIHIWIILVNLGQAKYFTIIRSILQNATEENEFCRLTFDVLRDQIGRSCDFYVDDVIVFLKNEEDHIRQVDLVLEKLLEANMRVGLKKSQFYKACVKYSWFHCNQCRCKIRPQKVKVHPRIL